MNMIRRYITDEPKVIVLTRPVDEIVESFARLRSANGWEGDPKAGLLDPESEPIMRSLMGVEIAKASNSGEFLFVEYADLISDPSSQVARIYEFCDWEPFTHDYDNVVNLHPEDDSVYGLAGMHDIRSRVGAI
jgi:hypothetical protein